MNMKQEVSLHRSAIRPHAACITQAKKDQKGETWGGGRGRREREGGGGGGGGGVAAEWRSRSAR